MLILEAPLGSAKGNPWIRPEHGQSGSVLHLAGSTAYWAESTVHLNGEHTSC